jgi:hypothetical protein
MGEVGGWRWEKGPRQVKKLGVFRSIFCLSELNYFFVPFLLPQQFFVEELLKMRTS